MTLKTNNRTPGKTLRLAQNAFLAVIACALAGCTTGGMDLFDSSPKVDRSLATATVPNRTTESVSDEKTVLNAVSSADLVKLGSAPLPWANTSTGSAGVVSEINEVNVGNQLCRQFLTTRHSYEGIARMRGNACLIGTEWTMASFAPQTN